ncbi:hypothetical protein V8B55DRAFT_1545382 [Mucor lusitanicus]
MSSNEIGFSLFPYQYVSSRVIAAAAAAASASSTPNAILQSPSYFGSIVVQFTRQVMRPKVVLPMLFVIEQNGQPQATAAAVVEEEEEDDSNSI